MEDPAASRPGESREIPRQAIGRIPVWACVLGGAGLLALLMIVLLLMGRPAWCECCYVKIWHGDVMSSENSQHIADWYTFTHVIHGFALYGLLWLVGRSWSLELRFLIALLTGLNGEPDFRLCRPAWPDQPTRGFGPEVWSHRTVERVFEDSGLPL